MRSGQTINNNERQQKSFVGDNWYIYANGKIKGPFSAEEIISRCDDSQASSKDLISCPGFKSWHSLHQVANLIQLSKLPKSQKPMVKAQSKNPEALLTEYTFGLKKQKEFDNSSPRIGMVATKKNQKLANKTKTLTDSVRHLKPNAANHFLLRGRLRLGEVRSPGLIAVLLFPLTLGMYWYFWFKTVARELSWHLYNDYSKNVLPPLWLAMIPGLHFYMIYRLAQLLGEVERQNSYQKVSPDLAMLLAVMPSLAIYYLQHCLNQHWHLHIDQSRKFKKS